MSSVYIVSSVREGKVDILEPHSGRMSAFIIAEDISKEYCLMYGGTIYTNPGSKTTIDGLEWIFYSSSEGEVKVVFRSIFIPNYNQY